MSDYLMDKKTGYYYTIMYLIC